MLSGIRRQPPTLGNQLLNDVITTFFFPAVTVSLSSLVLWTCYSTQGSFVVVIAYSLQ